MLDIRNIFKLLSLLAYLLFNHSSKCVNIPKQVKSYTTYKLLQRRNGLFFNDEVPISTIEFYRIK